MFTLTHMKDEQVISLSSHSKSIAALEIINETNSDGDSELEKSKKSVEKADSILASLKAAKLLVEKELLVYKKTKRKKNGNANNKIDGTEDIKKLGQKIDVLLNTVNAVLESAMEFEESTGSGTHEKENVGWEILKRALRQGKNGLDIDVKNSLENIKSFIDLFITFIESIRDTKGDLAVSQMSKKKPNQNKTHVDSNNKQNDVDKTGIWSLKNAGKKKKKERNKVNIANPNIADKAINNLNTDDEFKSISSEYCDYNEDEYGRMNHKLKKGRQNSYLPEKDNAKLTKNSKIDKKTVIIVIMLLSICIILPFGIWYYYY